MGMSWHICFKFAMLRCFIPRSLQDAWLLSVTQLQLGSHGMEWAAATTIEDASEHIASAAYHAFKAPAAFWRCYFIGISRADCHYPVCCAQAPLHEWQVLRLGLHLLCKQSKHGNVQPKTARWCNELGICKIPSGC